MAKKHGSHAAFEAELRQTVVSFERLPEPEALALWRHWCETFAQGVKSATGRWVHLGYHWHAFSYGYTHALALTAAREAYRAHWGTAQRERDVLLLPLEDERLAYRCRVVAPPEFQRVECNVCPPDLAWTMAFTHEDGWLGPYFTTREWAQRAPPAANPKRKGRR